MRFFIIDTYYSSFLEHFYLSRPSLSQRSYYEQKKALLQEQFGLADFYSKNLKALGQIAEEFIVNSECLQKKWAEENDIKTGYDVLSKLPYFRNQTKGNWIKKVVLAQVREFRPDIIYVQDDSFLDIGFLAKLKAETRLLVRQIASPIDDPGQLDVYDLIITAAQNFHQQFQQLGLNSARVKLAFEPDILKRITKKKTGWQNTFIGGFTQKHRSGTEILTKAATAVPVDFWGYGEDNLDKSSPILKRFHGQAWGMEAYNILANSRIVINRHVDVAGRYAGNMRMFETTGVGTFLITDFKDNLAEFFKIGKEIETYSSPEELIEKIKFYQKSDNARGKIARAGQTRTLNDHTYKQRMVEIIELIKKNLK
ncbi:MAG: glycosyltransferase [Patescibacteria group bacterium]|jgi:hypothetical protein